MSFTPWQKTVAILPKPFSLLSTMGSTYIVHEILKSTRRRRGVQHQIILGLSLCDMFGSISMFFGTWPIPSYVNDDGRTIYLASGNDRTCTAQAFFLQLYLAAPIYNASLSLYYLAVAKFGWNEGRLRRVRWWFHIFPIAIGLGTAIACEVIGIYGNGGWWCWITPEWNLYQLTIFFGTIWFVAAVIIIPCMVMLYLHVWEQEAVAARWRRGPRREVFSQSRKVLKKALFFSLSFVLTWIFPTLTRLLQKISGKTIPTLLVLTQIFTPLQGFINALVFLHPRYVKYRKEQRRLKKQARRFKDQANTALSRPNPHSRPPHEEEEEEEGGVQEGIDIAIDY